MPRYILRRRAIADLKEIADTINEEIPERGDSYADEILDKCAMRAGFPFSGRARPELSKGLRSFMHGEYVIFYHPCSYGISVVRVIHGRRDIRPSFF